MRFECGFSRKQLRSRPCCRFLRGILFGGLLIGAGAVGAMHADTGQHKEIAGPVCDSPREAVQTFLKAVRREELTLFDYTVDSSMIKPTRVEYVYELGSAIPTVTIYAELKKPLDIPGQPHLEVRAVTAVLDFAGGIVSTKAHAYARGATGGR